MENKSNRINFSGLLIFIILKLTKVINWSWWWVLSPLWIGIAIILIELLIWIIINKITNGSFFDFD